MTFTRRDFLKTSAAAVAAECLLDDWLMKKARADSGAAMNYHRADAFAGVPSASEFLRALVTTVPNGAVIAYGSEATSQTAAASIRDAIRRIPGQAAWDNMMPAAQFDALPFNETGQVHVIAVGTLADNVVLSGRSWLPTWWMDWDWYNTAYPWRLSANRIGLPYLPQTEFTAAGYGDWPKGEGRVGVIEVDRSHLFMEWMVRSRIESLAGGPVPGAGGDKFRGIERDIPNRGPVNDHAEFDDLWPVYPRDFPLRLIVRVTGSGAEGVVSAADALANQQMLSGVVLPEGVKALPAPVQSTLAPGRYCAGLPFVPPKSAGDYKYLGWLLPDAFEYDGLKADTGAAPQQMFRLKYMPKAGMTSFWTTPHRRAGEFEIACMKFSSSAEAASAGQAIDQAARSLMPFRGGRVTNWGVASVGPNLYLRSMVGQDGQDLLKQFSQLAEW